jgi:hypothetical protein
MASSSAHPEATLIDMAGDAERATQPDDAAA